MIFDSSPKALMLFVEIIEAVLAQSSSSLPTVAKLLASESTFATAVHGSAAHPRGDENERAADPNSSRRVILLRWQTLSNSGSLSKNLAVDALILSLTWAHGGASP
jgi:hypothetical protein